MPTRVQLSRKKGWRMPENTVKVCRPGKFGNHVAKVGTGYCMTNQEAVDLYRAWLFGAREGKQLIQAARLELRGKNLACWCKGFEACHADVLLKIANDRTAD